MSFSYVIGTFERKRTDKTLKVGREREREKSGGTTGLQEQRWHSVVLQAMVNAQGTFWDIRMARWLVPSNQIYYKASHWESSCWVTQNKTGCSNAAPLPAGADAGQMPLDLQHVYMDDPKAEAVCSLSCDSTCSGGSQHKQSDCRPALLCPCRSTVLHMISFLLCTDHRLSNKNFY
ncbi:hypothetical protein AOLI_G00073820 [Acnodon oligacanthus]